jgi:hypothetical protein
MNEEERFKKFKKLPEEIQNKILNSSEKELSNFLKLSHFERGHLKIPHDTRDSLRKIFHLSKEKDNFEDYEEELYDLLMGFGLKLSKNKLNELSKKEEFNFENIKRKKKIIKFKKSNKRNKKK